MLIEDQDLHAQTVYAELLSACATPLFDGHNIAFTKKKSRGKDYWYVNLKLGTTLYQRYLGPNNQETEAIIQKEKALWQKSAAGGNDRARLVDTFLSAGGIGCTSVEGKILDVLARSGVFLAGGVMVGTPAFRALGNNLGVRWRESQQTRDIDLASDYRYPIALKNIDLDLGKLLQEKEIGAVEIPALNRKHPSTRYKVRGKEYSIDILTPELGKPAEAPVLLPQFKTYAKALRFLDFLLVDVEPSVIPYGHGVLVNVPNPARFALHKLVVSQRRPAADRIKARKDLSQAEQILMVLLDSRPGMIMAAHEAAQDMGQKFVSQMNIGIKLLSEDLRLKLSEWIEI